jgi:hypothetical protein
VAPELRDGIEVFANWQTILFCMSVYLLTQFFRSIVEHMPATKSFSQGWIWQTVLLPFGPVGAGMLLAVVCKKFPWPMPVSNILSAKLMYGAACGVGCGWVFARVKEWFGVAAESNNPLVQKVVSKVINSTPSVPAGAFGPRKPSSPPPQ